MPRTSPYSIELSGAERTQLESQARKYTSPYIVVLRAKMILRPPKDYKTTRSHIAFPCPARSSAQST